MATAKRKPAARMRRLTRSSDGTEPEKAARRPAPGGQAAGRARSAAGADFPDLERTRLAERIEPDEVEGWAREFDVSSTRLREVISQVGPMVEDVKRVLERR
jgi:hypothetical protein